MSPVIHDLVQLSRNHFTRRRLLQSTAAGMGAMAAGGLLPACLSAQAADLQQKKRSIIVLWMQGAPSQFETFDPKPGTETGGPTKSISTAAPGIQIASTFPQVAKMMNEIALIRSLTNKEGNHQRATYQLHTGYIPTGSVKHPSLGANISRQIAPAGQDLPSLVTIGNAIAGIGAGYLGINYEPLHLNQAGKIPDNVAIGTSTERFDRRLGLLGQMDQQFAERGGASVVQTHRDLYSKASGMAQSKDLQVFDLDEEPAALKEAYGDTNFGRGCLLARRLVEAGVTYIEVRVGNWDTHADNFDATTRLAGEVDPAAATLIRDLKDRGLLDSTLVVWMGEFGRTPKINARTGRDHFPKAFNGFLAGAGIRGGQVIGRTNAEGTEIEDRPVTVGDLFTSICAAMKVNPKDETMSPQGRPLKVIESGEVIQGLFA